MPQSQRSRSQQSDAEPGPGQRPVEKFHDGPVHVSIWEHDGVKGAFRKASFQLRYRDQEKRWQTGASYGASDLFHLESAAREARNRIESWRQQNSARRAPEDAS